MDTLLLEAIDSLINDDEDKAAESIKQALIQKMQTKMGINESQNVDDFEDDEFIDDIDDSEDD